MADGVAGALVLVDDVAEEDGGDDVGGGRDYDYESAAGVVVQSLDEKAVVEERLSRSYYSFVASSLPAAR